jgi:hypothetical protein
VVVGLGISTWRVLGQETMEGVPGETPTKVTVSRSPLVLQGHFAVQSIGNEITGIHVSPGLGMGGQLFSGFEVIAVGFITVFELIWVVEDESAAAIEGHDRRGICGCQQKCRARGGIYQTVGRIDWGGEETTLLPFEDLFPVGVAVVPDLSGASAFHDVKVLFVHVFFGIDGPAWRYLQKKKARFTSDAVEFEIGAIATGTFPWAQGNVSHVIYAQTADNRDSFLLDKGLVYCGRTAPAKATHNL